MPKHPQGRPRGSRRRKVDANADGLDLGSDKLYFKIGEVAAIVGVPPYVLRYWETEFKAVKPRKSRSQQRVYRRRDVVTLLKIKHLLYGQKFTIAGARQQLKEAPNDCEMAAPSGVYLARQSLTRVQAVIDEMRGVVSGTERLERTAADPAAYVREAGGALAILDGADVAASVVARPRRKRGSDPNRQGVPGADPRG